jgi:transcription elongation factor Elf1
MAIPELDYNCPKCGANKKDLEILLRLQEKIQVLCSVCSKISVIIIEK